MSSEIAVPEACRPLRRDAARNRELILETAAAVFAEQGLEAGYDEIARRAGIGVGTVYRRFPERTALVQALFESRMAEMLVIAEESAQLDDSWQALVTFFERAVERQVANRGLKQLMTSVISTDEYRMKGQARLGPILDAMVARAQADGRLRSDVRAADIGVQLMIASSLTTPEQPDLWRRYLALFLDGIRARDDLAPLPSAPPEMAAIHSLMCNIEHR